MEYEHLTHPIAPIYDEHSRILILGSFPSRATRAQAYPYGHPQNRFWRVLSALLQSPLAADATAAERRSWLLQHHIALWDTIYSTEIKGSSDASIRQAVPTDLRPLVAGKKLSVFCNGQTSYKYYRKYHEPLLGLPAVVLPSTSPANASWSLDRLLEAWQVILVPLGNPAYD